MTVRIIIGDVRHKLAELSADSIDCCVTSPPYYGLRDYGVAGQIGLEETPDAYIAELVGVFREVRRVMKSSGTLWLNLGDSYAGGGGFSVGAPSTATSKSGKYGVTGALKSGGIKPLGPVKAKDLLMIPARVALALQQPYYAGVIKDERDRIWLAAMVDGEGCFYIHRRKAGDDSGAKFTKADGTQMSYLRTKDSFAPAFEVANTSEAIVARCMAIAKCGSISRQDKDRRQPLYRWTVRCDDARAIAREIYPYLVAKQQQCRIICGAPASGATAEAGWLGLKALHSGSTTDADFKAPESMNEPGWWLRSEIIWSKLNPMPESVTDRPTSAHEKIYLLAKSERYFFDADAVREEWTCDRDDMREKGVRTGTAYLQQGAVASNTKKPDKQRGHSRRHAGFNDRWDAMSKVEQQAMGRNIRNVWTIATQPYADAHFATFPPSLIEPCIKAGCPKGGTVLDPFGGAGTTGLVADRLERNAILIELNPEYAVMAEKRIRGDAPLFADVRP